MEKDLDEFDYEDEEIYPPIIADELFLPQCCPLGDECIMAGLHTEDDCHTSADLEDSYKDSMPEIITAKCAACEREFQTIDDGEQNPHCGCYELALDEMPF